MTKCFHKCFYLLAEESKVFLREEIVKQDVTEGLYVSLSSDKLHDIARSLSCQRSHSPSEGALTCKKRSYVDTFAMLAKAQVTLFIQPSFDFINAVSIEVNLRL